MAVESGHTKVAVYGLGYIGRMVFEAIQNENFFFNQKLKLVGAVDIVDESCRWSESKGVKAFHSISDLVRSVKPDVVIHTTGSNLSSVTNQILEVIEQKIPLISTTEELFYPWLRNSKLAAKINEACLKNNVAVLGTGVNPGFIMDVLPAVLTQVCQTIESIKVTRVVNASTRRPPLQRRIGVGLDEASFQKNVLEGRIAPVGLLESLDFLSTFLGWAITGVDQSIEPILAERAMKTASFSIKKDSVLGYRQRVIGSIESKKVIELDLRVFMEAQRPGDQITIKGSPPMSVWIEGGVPGDPGAVASLIRGIPIVLKARPGIVRRLERGNFVESV